MQCPNCGAEKTSVKETIDLTFQINRRRYCPVCHRYFFTMEQVAELGIKKEAYSNDARFKR